MMGGAEMIIKAIKNGYIISLHENEIPQLNTFNNIKSQHLSLIKFTTRIIKKIGIQSIGDNAKIFIARKSDFISILILPLRKSNSTFALMVKTEKELLTLSEQLYKNGCSKLCISSVYIYNENYYLIITPITKSKKVIIISKEFCLNIISQTNKILNIQKYGTEICSIDAIEKLGEAISK